VSVRMVGGPEACPAAGGGCHQINAAGVCILCGEEVTGLVDYPRCTYCGEFGHDTGDCPNAPDEGGDLEVWDEVRGDFPWL